MINIHKEVYGQGRPVVLIHGWAMHTGVWRTFAQQLGQHCQVTCLDLPGHGLSETVDPYTLEQISSALIEASPKTSFCLLGWSLGATVALAIANAYPQQVNSLIMLAGNPHFLEENGWAGVESEVLESFATSLSDNLQLTLVRFLALQVNGLSDGKQVLKEMKKAIQECDPPGENVLQRGLDILKYADLRESLTTMHCPVNIIQGDKDALIPVQVSQDIQKLRPDFEINIIPGAGHLPFLSHQSEVIEIIKRLI